LISIPNQKRKKTNLPNLQKVFTQKAKRSDKIRNKKGGDRWSNN